MKWHDSYIYKPKHGTQIFVWDLHDQKPVMLNAFWDQDMWKPQWHFPFWSYVLDGIEPIEIDENSLRNT